MQDQRPQDYVKDYYTPANAPKGGKVYDLKKLKDGSKLTLESGISGVEFTNTRTFVLRLDGDLLVSRPESAMLSEAAYRSLMGKISSRKDFYDIQKKMDSLAETVLKEVGYQTVENFGQ